jgi:hypothetical protein
MALQFSKGYYQKKKGPDPEHILCLVRILQKYFFKFQNGPRTSTQRCPPRFEFRL